MQFTSIDALRKKKYVKVKKSFKIFELKMNIEKILRKNEIP